MAGEANHRYTLFESESAARQCQIEFVGYLDRLFAEHFVKIPDAHWYYAVGVTGSMLAVFFVQFVLGLWLRCG